MKNIGDYYYDETGLCPTCGAGLVSVPIFSGNVLNTHVSYKRQDINTKVKTTTITYTDIQPMTVGYCLECEKRAHAAKEEAKAAKQPKPIFVIIAALLLVACAIGILTGVKPDGTSDTPIIAGLSILGAAVGLFWLIWALINFFKQKKLHEKYASGWREPFQPRTQESLSHWAAYYMNKQPSSRTYLDIEQVKKMQNPFSR